MCVRSGKQRAVLSLPSGSSMELEPDCGSCLTPLHLPARSQLPEIFTFDPESVAAPKPRWRSRRATGSGRSRKPRRVLYPAGVVRQKPRPLEGSAAKRWLLYLCLIVLAQICTEEPEEALPLPASLHRPLSEKPVLQEVKLQQRMPEATCNLTCYRMPSVLHAVALSL